MLKLPAGISQLRITQPAPVCRRSVRVRAPRGARRVRIFVNGTRVRSVRGRAARRAIRIRLPATRARVVVRATTRKGRRLVRRKTYRGC